MKKRLKTSKNKYEKDFIIKNEKNACKLYKILYNNLANEKLVSLSQM